MRNQIFVRNLPYALTVEELKQHFAPFGEITQAIILKEHETQRSRGFGFITFTTEASASHAIETMQGQLLGGRCLQVNPALPFVKKPELQSSFKQKETLTKA